MSNLRQMRTLTRITGRRTALRYLAAGLGASLLAACGSRGKSDGFGPGPKGPLGQAVAAFVRGTWHARLNPSTDEEFGLLVTVTGASWTIEPYGQEEGWEDGAVWDGTWDLDDGRLTLQGPTSPYTPNLVRKVAAFDVPDTIGDSASLRLAWQVLNGSSLGADDELRIDYAGGTLRLIHTADVAEAGTRTEIRCTRV